MDWMQRMREREESQDKSQDSKILCEQLEIKKMIMWRKWLCFLHIISSDVHEFKLIEKIIPSQDAWKGRSLVFSQVRVISISVAILM